MLGRPGLPFISCDDELPRLLVLHPSRSAEVVEGVLSSHAELRLQRARPIVYTGVYNCTGSARRDYFAARIFLCIYMAATSRGIIKRKRSLVYAS